jgi:chromosomal replication initiation ATPase DnaA
MKEEIFEQYVNRITNLFRISREQLFSKNKSRELVDARHMLYYMCSRRPMRITIIQKFMAENGYDIKHSTIIHGINSMGDKIKLDKDYMTVVKEMERMA